MPGSQSVLERGAAGDDLVDLDRPALPSVGRRALADAESEDRQHFGRGRQLGDRDVAVLGLPSR